MIVPTEKYDLNKNNKEINEDFSNYSISSNLTFYEKLNNETKKDILFLIKSGYDKKMIIKLYIFLKPANVNEAIHYLTKNKGIYQHIFFSSSQNKDSCVICRKRRNMHIRHIYNSFVNNSSKNKQFSKTTRINVKKKEIKKKYICKICEEEILKEQNENECKLCHNLFCNDCLYLYIKNDIIKGKYKIQCPDSDCDCILTEKIIDKILSFNNSNKNEVISLKNKLENNKTKEMVLSNPNLMFCLIVDCNGYCKKIINKNYNTCNKGHKFCPTCGELYHKDGICKDGEKVDQLFEQIYKKYDLKKCPYCQIVTLKNEGCNHMTCLYCRKNWCWLCNGLFETTEEHYGNIKSGCYKRMMNNLRNQNNQNNNQDNNQDNSLDSIYESLPFYIGDYAYYLDIFYLLYKHEKYCCNNIPEDCLLLCMCNQLFLIFICMMAIPIFPHITIQKFYYFKYIDEIKKKYKNKILLALFILVEELLFFIYIIHLIIIHYIYTVLVLPIYGVYYCITN